MFAAAAVLAGLALIGQSAPQAAAPAAKPRALAAGQSLDWTADAYPGPVRLIAGDTAVLIEPFRSEEGLVGPRLTVTAPGKAAAVLEGERSGLSFPSRITPIRWNAAGETLVLLESYTGGAHCCTAVQAAVPEGKGFRIVDLGRFDGEQIPEVPRDLDGDGALDFVLRDDSLLYAFSSYADSAAPPKILNIVDGKAVDVSHRPAFRSLFLKAMADYRKTCSEGSNGACAGLALAAARAGKLEEAWPDVVRFHDAARRDWPTGCRVAVVEEECPAGQEITYATYPEALRAFLVEHDYVSR
jgi:hypothetical protein